MLLDDPNCMTTYLSVFSRNAGKCERKADQSNSEDGHFLCSVAHKQLVLMDHVDEMFGHHVLHSGAILIGCSFCMIQQLTIFFFGSQFESSMCTIRLLDICISWEGFEIRLLTKHTNFTSPRAELEKYLSMKHRSECHIFFKLFHSLSLP